MDTGDLIPPSLPLQKGGFPLFGKEGLGEIFGRMCLINYGLLSNSKNCDLLPQSICICVKKISLTLELSMTILLPQLIMDSSVILSCFFLLSGSIPNKCSLPTLSRQ